MSYQWEFCLAGSRHQLADDASSSPSWLPDENPGGIASSAVTLSTHSIRCRQAANVIFSLRCVFFKGGAEQNELISQGLLESIFGAGGAEDFAEGLGTCEF
jgi:hypothetical protein